MANRIYVRRLKLLALCTFFLLPIYANAQEPEKPIYTLWSTTETCKDEAAQYLAIESLGDLYKIALCTPSGCRIPIEGFGKEVQQANYRNDPRLTWVSDTSFEIALNGTKTRFFRCR